ncbi:family 20 glycosylhydrolase [Phenylobacterium montanum]|uniref:beta-N-acetylhexosaminidase n=1 Tax=Phenylobacterium montanum TaxID=2823693 RepID=A0A975G0K6_9CAUL|nr:family 20 glycosylhydrolase [Caulobacter sp. S6]QUD88566.1 family 20 glycosylhydrolase [Caulobacter sp. S6]
MAELRTALVLGASILALSASAASAAPASSLVPLPASQEIIDQASPVAIAEGARIETPAGDADARAAADYLRDLTERTRGLGLRVASAGASPAVVFRRDPTVAGGPEAYDLRVEKGRVTISAAGGAGLFYGAVTTWQLMTPDAAKGPVSIPAQRIHDAPRFSWRGLMIDSARHYQSPAEIEHMIDWMALHKLNVLHWHLTDDQGWRLEIKKYPRLTEVGGWRVPAGAAAQADIDPATGKPRLYGGIYTQDQVRRIVAYAAARHVMIVPEIEMPGHALSAILAYPQLGSDGPAPAAIQSDAGVFPYLYNVDDKTFGFLGDVLTEVMDLFPGPFIHVGGDEAVKDQWKANPAIQARIKALGLKDEDALQSWFTHRMDDFIVAHGRRLIGWDEILEGGPLPASATVMSWHGVDGAVTAAKAGHDAVVSPAPVLYFDNTQARRPDEPPGRGYLVTLKDVYGFDPAPAGLSDDQRAHILGLQANLWTEHIRTDDRLTAMAFPRAAAVAEAGWSPQGRRDWLGFAARMPVQFERYHALGLPADPAALEVAVDQSPGDAVGQASVRLSTQLGLGQIRYTTDGSAPSPSSPAYASPLTVVLPSTLKAAAFADGAQVSPTAESKLDALSVLRRTSQQLQSCSGKLVLNLEDDGPPRGPRARFMVDVINPCWIYPEVDLGAISKLTVSVGQVPFNFQLGADRAKIPLHAPATANGELEVRLDRCDAPPIAVLPLPPARPGVELSTLSADLPKLSGRHALCLSFTAKSLDPMSVIDWVQLVPAASASAKAGS